MQAQPINRVSGFFGIEGDINYLGFKEEFSPGANLGGLGAEASLDAFGTIRGRVGLRLTAGYRTSPPALRWAK
jgi:hypothetical protein